MLDRKAWLSASTLIHLKGVLLGWGQDSVQASQVHPHQTLSWMSLWMTLLCALVHSHVGTERGYPQTVPTDLGAWNHVTVQHLLVCWSIQSSFHWNYGPSPAPEKQPHTIIPGPPNFTLGTMQSDCSTVSKYCSPGNLQTQTSPSDCQMEKHNLSLQRTCLHCSRVQWWRALHHCIALDDVWLGCSCSAMETHSMKLSTHCSWANLKATWSLEVCSDWLCRKLATTLCASASADPAPSLYTA